jgi:hypothetical protein
MATATTQIALKLLVMVPMQVAVAVAFPAMEVVASLLVEAAGQEVAAVAPEEMVGVELMLPEELEEEVPSLTVETVPPQGAAEDTSAVAQAAATPVAMAPPAPAEEEVEEQRALAFFTLSMGAMERMVPTVVVGAAVAPVSISVTMMEAAVVVMAVLAVEVAAQERPGRSSVAAMEETVGLAAAPASA